MSNLQAIADRFEIEALRGEFTDAVMMRDYDRIASLFTPDGAVRIPYIGAEAAGREQIRAWGERVQALWDYFVQTTHAGTIQLAGDTASGRAYICELIRLRDGRAELNYAMTSSTRGGGCFARRVHGFYDFTSSSLPCSARHFCSTCRCRWSSCRRPRPLTAAF